MRVDLGSAAAGVAGVREGGGERERERERKRERKRDLGSSLAPLLLVQAWIEAHNLRATLHRLPLSSAHSV